MELTILFSLEWYVYAILYLGIGVVSVFKVFVFFLYHYYWNRKLKRPPIRILEYISPVYPPVLGGIFLASIILIILLFIV